MRQILANSSGVLIARMPRPIVESGHILVRVHYSLVSVGTEVASLRPTVPTEATTLEKAKTYSGLAQYYLGAAVRDPRKAARRAFSMAQSAVRHAMSASPTVPSEVSVGNLANISWQRCAARSFVQDAATISLVTDDSEASYQVMSSPIDIPEDMVPIVHIKGTVKVGAIAIGLLSESKDAWLGSRTFDEGPMEDRLIFDPRGSRAFTIVLAGAGVRKFSEAQLSRLEVVMVPPTENGLPHSELDQQGWNLGYSAVGEVVEVGSGIVDIAVGDIVACGGAGKANHADYVSVPRNLACRVPPDCDEQSAATTTVGTIALQGVRRASPQLGERICVVGLGLIGQLTVQMLRAAGCKVIGLDLDSRRVQVATELGMDLGASDMEVFKVIVRDATEGRGADRVLITAATKSDAVINLAMEVTRAKGVVVIVGDVGLNVARQHFYRKEIDLLMSTSYGPGRYDQSYEDEGHDYPFAYVRWTLNRNMRAYMEMIVSGRLNAKRLIEKVIDIADAPETYRALALTSFSGPLGVLIRYPDDKRRLQEPTEATAITVRGHRKAPSNLIRYALIGAGAFGTSMLVPQMQKRKDRYFLRGVVSRNTTTGGNFARVQQAEVFTTNLDDVLADPNFELVVIATRHHEHADQVVRSLTAGKHVFVEKPLALTWEDLDTVVSIYRKTQGTQLLMVGFNRRFSPAMQALGTIVQKRRSPIVVNYRLNGGYIPPDHWVHGREGGGRNIGEACHMYDVFRFLAGATVRSVQATAINPGSLPYKRNDNFCATVGYADGSVGNLTYTALGPKQGLAKERVEVFCDGEAYIIDDYRSLMRGSDNKVLWQNDTVDKGHFEELSRLGDAIATGATSPIPFEELVETTAVALRVEDLLFRRDEQADDFGERNGDR